VNVRKALDVIRSMQTGAII